MEGGGKRLGGPAESVRLSSQYTWLRGIAL